ncbi:CMP-N [Parelusimicrobium proximum]|uniref:acylneuraminate cytidylyltransferase family protein n=1 Tax=Parelusimicrobium proximum TaxID=3228953 RepID=UPI003D1866B4
MNMLITICARGGSKGVPGKNIKEINGMPLIAYSINCALKFAEKHGADIGLSTDSAEIKDVCAGYGLTTSYVRPAELAGDIVSKGDTIADLVFYEEKKRGKKYDFILDLDVTAPMRTQEDLEKAFEIIKGRADALDLFSVSPAHRNPYFNMVEDAGDGFCVLSKDGSLFTSRQSAPKVYDLNASFYFYRRAYFDAKPYKVINSRSMYYVVPHICFDVDSALDFEYMEYLIKNNKLDFEL